MRHLILFTALIFLIHCGGGDNGSNPPTTEEQINNHLQTAWMKFENAAYDSAEYYFDKALALDNAHSEGQAGKAWSQIMLDDADLSSIETLLNNAKTDSLILNDVLAALGIVQNLQKKYSASVSNIDQLLNRIETYVFQHKTDIDYQDMLIIKAHSYFYNKNFDYCYEALLEINQDYIFDPDDSSTWEIDGKKYSAYEGAISALLAKLSNQYKSF